MVTLTAEQPKTMSAEEFDVYALLPQNRDRLLQYIGGEVVEVVSNSLSSKIAMLVGGRIMTFVEAHNLGHVTGADGGYRVSGERYIPDAAFISYSRQPELSYEEGYLPVAPDLAVEVLLPGNTEDEMAIKIANYLAAGTVVWMFKPLPQTVAVFVPGKLVRILTVNDTLDGGDGLPGFTRAVKDAFPRKRENI